MIDVAGRAAGCVDPDESCDKTVSLLGLDLAAGSLPFYLTSFATILSAFILPIVGAMVDVSPRKKWHMAGFAWAGAFCASTLFFMKGENWQLGAVAIVLSSVLAGCSLVSYSAILCDISTEDERDRVSSRGWAFGYLGGGVLLLVNLVVVLGNDAIGLSTGMAVRISLLSAALWWAGFTIIPFVGLRNRAPVHTPDSEGRNWVQRSFGQLYTTLRELRNYPMTLTFLVAYLFYNDGIQTVIYSAAVYGSDELKFGQSVLIGTILLIQFVAFGGALFFGRLAGRYGAYRAILWGTFALDGDRRVRDVPPRQEPPPVPRRRGGHRRRARRNPGALPVLLQPADPTGQGGRVLRPLQRVRARHVVVRRPALRRGLPGHRLLPARDRER